MPEIAVCPKCQARYRTGGVKPGRRLRCRKCRSIFTVQDSGPAGALDGPPPEEAALPAALGDKSSLLRAQMSASVAPAASADEEKYTVEDEIARGGMGAVLRAADRDLGREVAMKVMLDAMDEGGRARFVEEARLTGQLEHPNIVPVHELGVDAEGKLFFTMKLVKGRSLAEVLKGLREEPGNWKDYTLGRLLSVFVNVCNAMAFAHAKGIIHRDLKPANVMLGDYGEVLVMDWGLAKVLGKAESRAPSPSAVTKPKTSRFETSADKTMEGSVLGTPYYMPPEQARGDIASLDQRCDIYSLGAILYEILTFKPPVEGKTLQGLLKSVVDGSIVPPERRTPERHIPRELSAVAMKALATKRENRYPTVEALRRDIELFLEGRAVTAKPDTAWETLLKLIRRNKGVSVAASVAALVVVALAAGSYVINLHERNRAEGALADFKVEQDKRLEVEARRLKEQRESGPAFFEAARRASERRDWDSAILNAAAAFKSDPELVESLLLQGKVLLVKGDYARAGDVLSTFLRLRPEHADANELRVLCEQALRETEDSTPIRSSMATVLLRTKDYPLAEALVRRTDALVAMYNERMKAAWGALLGAKNRVVADPQGRLCLNLDRSPEVKGGIQDLRPVQGMLLAELSAVGQEIVELSAIEGMPLEKLTLRGAPVVDITPLRGMGLKSLNLEGTRIDSLQSLKGMPLESLWIGQTKVTDLSPLEGAPLTFLDAGSSPIKGIEPLRGMKIRFLDLFGARVKDYSPLKGMPLENLNIGHTYSPIDLSLLWGMPLKVLTLSNAKLETLDGLEAVPTLQVLTVNYVGGLRDLSALRTLRLQELHASETRVHDLSPLKGMGLTRLILTKTKVHDLEPLRGMPLRELRIDDTPVSDLSPLKGMPLDALNICSTNVSDLSPLMGMKLGTLSDQRPGRLRPDDEARDAGRLNPGGPWDVCSTVLILLLALQDDPGRLIERFRSEKVEEREDVAKKLRDLGVAAVPALKAATRDRDAELVGRAKAMLEELGKTVFQILGDGKEEDALVLIEHVDGLVRSQDRLQQTPLHVAARFDRRAAAGLLLTKGADVNAVSYNRFTPLWQAASAGKVDMARLLLKQGASLEAPSNGGTPLQGAAQAGHREVVKALLEAGASYDVVTAIDLSDVDRVAALMAANPEVAKGEYVLHRASRRGNAAIVKLLLDHSADANDIRTHWSDPPLYSALEHAPVVKLLLEKGADPRARVSMKGMAAGSTLLHLAASSGYLETARLLVERGAEVEALRRDDRMDPAKEWVWTPLHAAASGGQVKLIEFLLEKKADLTRRTSGEENALGIASRLIRRGSDERTKESNRRYAETVRFLAGRGLEVDLFAAIALDDADRAAELLKEDPGRTRAKDLRKDTPLHRAIDLDRRAIVGKLLEAGADLEARDEHESTPLHGAAFWGNPAIAKMLLDRGARVDVKDKSGGTPLSEALRVRRPGEEKEYDEVIRLLKAAGGG